MPPGLRFPRWPRLLGDGKRRRFERRGWAVPPQEVQVARRPELLPGHLRGLQAPVASEAGTGLVGVVPAEWAPVEVAQPREDQAARGRKALPESAVRRLRLLLEHWMPMRTMPLWAMRTRAFAPGRAEPGLAVPTQTELVEAPAF